MDLFVGNLPGEATLMDLQTFVGDFELRADFQRCQGRDARDRTYHFFIVHATSRKEGLALLKRLNGQEFSGRRVIAREYFRRRPASYWDQEERRINPW
jgi:hypothetical protein